MAMPYTLMKGLGWFLAAFVLGIVIGWLIRSVTARRQIAKARAQHVDAVELERLRGRIANLEPVVAERDELRAAVEAARGAASALQPDPARPPDVAAAPDVGAASAVLGRPVVQDDLTVIPGISPAVEDLCHGIGVRTWFDLSTTEASLLRTMLVDAGPRFSTLDPSLWPEMARLLAAAEWQRFKDLSREGAAEASETTN
jgi:predicted flap endonuclease-1-like 5' DNA nuclease